jgi:hypothetical protein
MKQLVKTYSLNGAALSLTGVNVPLNQILLVSNSTTGVVHYSISGPAPTNYTQGSSSVITLATAPGANDKLTIYYDDGLPNTASSASVTSFSSLNASAQILPSNSSRKAVVLANPSTGSLVYVLFGTGIASSTNYSIALQPSDTATISSALFALQGRSTGGGNIQVTELT